MRPNQNTKRSRGRGNRRPQGQSGNRSMESNGPAGKVRGSATQICDKYQSLAREAQTGGNRIMAENLFQHAEHYHRLMTAAVERNTTAPQQGADSDHNNVQQDSAPPDSAPPDSAPPDSAPPDSAPPDSAPVVAVVAEETPAEAPAGNQNADAGVQPAPSVEAGVEDAAASKQAV